MSKDKRNLLEVLKAELEFLQMGGYRHTSRAAWRPEFMFQDSLTCLNVDPTRPHRPCSDCVMIQLIPEGLRGENIPCHFIPMNVRGEKLDSLYRSGTREEVESAVAEWLKTKIARLELARAEWIKACDSPEVHVQAKFVDGI
jgi:hypothetical protein